MLKVIIDKLAKPFREKSFDPFLSLFFVTLTVFGLVIIYSASSYLAIQSGLGTESFLYKQIVAVLLGIGFIYLIVEYGQSFLLKMKFIKIIAIILCLLLVIVLFTQPINGAKSWLPLGILNLQPAELAKLFLIWSSAYWYAGHDATDSMTFVRFPLAVYVVITVLVLLQPDMGTWMIITLIALFLLNFTGAFSITTWVTGAGLVLTYLFTYLPSSIIEMLPIKAYKISRMISFHDPFQHAKDTGYQVLQGFYGLARGGLMGLGLGQSVQKTGFLPEAHTDFILAVIGEELGFIGVLFVLILLFGLVAFIFWKGKNCRSEFAKYICYGIASMFFIQTSINVGALLSLAPITGVPLPFISYGGSSYLSSSMAIGFVFFALKYDQAMQQSHSFEQVKKIVE